MKHPMRKIMEAVDMRQQVIDAFQQADKNPLTTTSHGNRFWMISSPTNLSDLNDTIVLVDVLSIMKIGIGTMDIGDIDEQNYELYPYDQKEAAIDGAIQRWTNRPVA